MEKKSFVFYVYFWHKAAWIRCQYTKKNLIKLSRLDGIWLILEIDLKSRVIRSSKWKDAYREPNARVHAEVTVVYVMKETKKALKLSWSPQFKTRTRHRQRLNSYSFNAAWVSFKIRLKLFNIEDAIFLLIYRITSGRLGLQLEFNTHRRRICFFFMK